MLYVFSKLFEIVAQPGNLLVLLLALGVILFALGARRWGGTLIVLVTLAFVAIMVLPLGRWASEPLERRFPQAQLPDRIDGIILLGGAVSIALTKANGQVALNDMAERITETLALARRYPDAPVLLSGGDPSLVPIGLTEAAATQTLLAADGLDPRRILLEDRSRNTWENAVYSKEMAKPKEGQVWVLVTSANHMPRAMGCFRRAEFDVVPYPVDYNTGPRALFNTSFSGDLHLLGEAAHEWMGLVAYRLLGRTDALLPAPISATSAR
ncbi:MAG TPA: YdcF family protein [Stellaceae bacterium]|nr:YdcF family protein [Stellaceae bacterium]